MQRSTAGESRFTEASWKSSRTHASNLQKVSITSLWLQGGWLLSFWRFFWAPLGSGGFHDRRRIFLCKSSGCLPLSAAPATRPAFCPPAAVPRARSNPSRRESAPYKRNVREKPVNFWCRARSLSLAHGYLLCLLWWIQRIMPDIPNPSKGKDQG